MVKHQLEIPNPSHSNTDKYAEHGYFIIRNFLTEDEIAQLQVIVTSFHMAWQKDNHEFYQTRAVNSAYLTDTTYLSDKDRLALFKFIASDKLMCVVEQLISPTVAFMNTQLFFNPVSHDQKNYWHRDSQYHLSIKEQQESLTGSNVIHFRLPVCDEPGIEVIPGSHKRWDNAHELEVRLAQNGHQHYEPLERGVCQPLNAGDLMVFSANMIHRGLYGGKRLSFDVIFCDDAPDLLKFVKKSCLPNAEEISQLDRPQAFINSLKHQLD